MEHYKSNVFRNFMDAESKDLQIDDEEDPLIASIRHASSVVKAFQRFLQTLFNSEISVKSTIEKFQRIHAKNGLKDELEKLGELSKRSYGAVQSTFDTIQQLFEMKQVQQTANVVLKVVEILNAKVPVETLEKIVESENMQEVQLSKAVTKDVVESGKKFRNWNQNALKGSEALHKTAKLISWLKENIHSTQQLKNFVELASIRYVSLLLNFLFKELCMKEFTSFTVLESLTKMLIVYSSFNRQLLAIPH